jgi:DNA-3-methyladenine glycosylase II
MAMKRFRVAEDSMRPTLSPGDEIVATDARPARVGDIVVFPHPGRDDFWMVKRRVDPPRAIGPDQAWVISDDSSVTLADSRTLGPVPLNRLWTVVSRLDDDSFVEASHLLGAEDQALAGVVAAHGLPGFWRRPSGLSTLILLVLEQQVSLESGAAVFRRLREEAGGIRPESLLAMGTDGVRGVGVTRQKTTYILNLAEAVVTGALDLATLENRSADEARRSLLELKGIGPWTADAYLLSALGHLDVFPVGDRALQVGAGEVLGMSQTPDEAQLELISQPWRPLRAVAARLIWHAYLTVRGRVEPDHGTPIRERA